MAYSFFMVSGDKKVQFPVAPSELTIKVNGRNESIDLMNEGEVNLLKSPGLTEVSFKALIPQVGNYPFAVNKEPIDTFTNFLNEMLENKKPFRFVVVRAAGTKLLFDTNLKVACEGYQLNESAENGYDVELEISLKQYRDYGVKTITLVTIQTTQKVDTTTKVEETVKVTEEKPREEPPKKVRTYKVKYKNDCLWSISKKYYGTGTKWKKIYNANKEVIEAACRKRGSKSSKGGHCIHRGTVLVIP